ncbi:hypothetical protein N7536_007675, partial [Penicillium majusculum]
DSAFFFAFATIKGSQRYPSGLGKESSLHSTSVSLTHHLHVHLGINQGVPSKSDLKKIFQENSLS